MRYHSVSLALIGAIFLSDPAVAVISGPTSSTGSFQLAWDNPAAILQEQGTTTHLTGGTANFTRPAGTHIFEEKVCFGFPGYGGPLCGITDTHSVVVTSGGGSSTTPLSSLQQSELQFQLHVGDFDGNGYTDIFVNRLTPGAVDGSMQDSILYRDSSGSFTASAPTAAQAVSAASYPVSSVLAACLGEINFDGHQDLIIEGMDAQFGSSFDPEMMVFAPATYGSSVPLGVKAVDQGVQSFQYDQAQYAINNNYYADQLNLSFRPVFATSVVCVGDTNPIIATPSFCSISIIPIGVIAVASGDPTYNPQSPGFSIFNRVIFDNDNYSGGFQWWEMAKRFKAVYGVYAFGYNADGSRAPTNYSHEPVSQTDEDEFRKIHLALQTAIFRFWAPSSDTSLQAPLEDWPEHSYSVFSSICPIGVGICTEEQLFCWMRRIPAPREGGEINFPNGEEIVLTGGNPIVTHEFPAQSTVVNETRPKHVLYDPAQAEDCGANPDLSQIPDRCAVVVRKIVPQGGFLNIETQGRGNNANGVLVSANQKGGEIIFESIDRVLRAIIQRGTDCFTTPG